MGNAPLGSELAAKKFPPEAKAAVKRFGDEEIRMIREAFKGLAQTSNGATIDKETFLKFFPLGGLLGERLFEVIASAKNTTGIKYTEFVYGLAILLRGTRDEKLKFIFELFDINGTGSIARSNLLTMLYQLPIVAGSVSATSSEKTGTSNEESKEDAQVKCIQRLVDDALPTNDPTAALTFDEFMDWCERCPEVSEMLLRLLPNDVSTSPVTPLDIPSASSLSLEDGELGRKRSSVMNIVVRRNSPEKLQQLEDQEYRSKLDKTRQLLEEARSICPATSLAVKIGHILDEFETTAKGVSSRLSESPVHEYNLFADIPDVIPVEEHDDLEDNDTMCGYLWKRGARLRQMLTRYFVLQDNFLYYYTNEDDTVPRGALFMCGYYVESSGENPIVEKSEKYYGIELVPESGATKLKRTIYAKSVDVQNKWVNALRQATEKRSIGEHYIIGEELGQGKFSVVCQAHHRETLDGYAVKIIDKSKLDLAEKELLRTEVAILKLVHHPHIVQLVDIFEDPQFIYIVTELVAEGDLFQHIEDHKRFSESQAQIVMKPLLDSVAYLHRLGIVHRDLKPENILCGEDLGDLKLADFGLSKLAHPDEVMTMACGTLHYAAPEVLAQSGYGQEADNWSLGVIMFLLLMGELPFNGRAKQDIFKKILHGEVKVEENYLWRSLSTSGKSLLSGLLTKDPTKRITAECALRHPWFHESDQ